MVPTPAPGGASTTDPLVSEVVPDTVSELVPNPTPSNRSQRVRRALTYLQDFICHTTRFIPPPHLHPLQPSDPQVRDSF